MALLINGLIGMLVISFLNEMFYICQCVISVNLTRNVNGSVIFPLSSNSG